jgi:ketosteroid isomerase-like protein
MQNLITFVRNRPKTSFASFVVGLCLLAVVASWIIDTDREKISRAIDETRQALKEGDTEGVMRYVAGDFRQNDVTRDDLRGYIERMFEKFGAPSLLKTTWSELRLSNGSATCKVDVSVSFLRIYHSGGFMTTSRWKLKLRKGQDRWLFARIQPLQVNNQPVDDLAELLAAAEIPK